MDSKLSYDINIEILSRTSLKSFDAMRCTNKEYNMLSYDSHLLDVYKQRNDILSGLIIQNMKYGRYDKEFAQISSSRDQSHGLDLDYIPIQARIQASSEQGIIVVESPFHRLSRYLYHVTKPSTMQFLALPILDGYHKTEMVAVVVMSSSSTSMHYKIIRLCRCPHDDDLFEERQFTTYYCHIFDSTTWKWSNPDSIILPYQVLLKSPAITASGSIYILLTNDSIMKFDAYSNKWTTFSSPITPFNFLLYPVKKLAKYQGKLAFTCKRSYGFWEIWILKIDDLWEKLYVLNKEEALRRMTLEALYDSDTSVMLDDKTVVFYKFKTGETIDKVVLKSPPDQMFIYRSDFESITHRK